MKKKSKNDENGSQKIESSFRDPSGFLFRKDGILYRSISESYKDDYDFANKSGLYKGLMESGSLVRHQEVEPNFVLSPNAYKIIKLEEISFISYPYEWSFSQLKDAALLTLDMQKKAMERGMSLKDASAYNIQFYKGRTIFIDTLSFEKYEDGSPWIAYKQFCQHFLAPLSLMSYVDLRLAYLSRLFIDGVPLDLASSLLPWKTLFKPLIASHIHLHAKGQKRYSDSAKKPNIKISKMRLMALLDSLESAVNNLYPKGQKTEWQDYYGKTNYSPDSLLEKKRIVSGFLSDLKPNSVWDLGANTGFFSRLASDAGIETIAFDIDPMAVELNYIESRLKKETWLLPLITDLSNPSPSIGWAGEERMSLAERGPADMVLALALIHHLAISNNLPFDKIAEYFSQLGGSLVIEFVPKNDSQVRKLLKTRKDIFTEYNENDFEKAFERYFSIESKKNIKNSERVVYLMKKK